MPTAVYLEVAPKKTFACAYDWPGWCRSGRDGAAALEALAEYARRYAPVAERAGFTFPKAAGDRLEVLHRVKGNATTEFGAPGAIAPGDEEPLTRGKAARYASLVEASWAELDRVVEATPASLRKGPRGGGRDRDKMLAHVLEAEASYARTIGVRHKPPAIGDRAAISALRADILAVLRAGREPEPGRGKGWPRRYAARRIAWHALDHAWEMQDRSS